VQVELDLVQVAVAALRRLDPTDDPLQASVWVIKDDLNRLHALGGPPGDHTAAADKLDQLAAQRRMQILDKPCADAATLASREAQPGVRPDDQLDATAQHLAVAAGVRRVAALCGH
jgi:hypothetical protein